MYLLLDDALAAGAEGRIVVRSLSLICTSRSFSSFLSSCRLSSASFLAVVHLLPLSSLASVGELAEQDLQQPLGPEGVAAFEA